MKYGLPYKGSKNKLAERIVHLLPKRTHLIDLFCGGCAVSHAALLIGKYEHIHINDINWMCPTLFIDALNGKYNDESRWISHEDFSRLKDTDPYVSIVWSFGSNMRSYLYSREIEPLKKAIHYAIFFSDYSLGKELGFDLSFIDHIPDPQKRYIAVKHYFSKHDNIHHVSFDDVGGAKVDAAGIIQPDYTTCGDWSRWKDETQLHRLQHRERHHRLPRYSAGGGKTCRLHPLCSTTSRSAYQKTARYTATSLTKAQTDISRKGIASTMSVSISGVSDRRNPYSYPLTKCPPPASTT